MAVVFAVLPGTDGACGFWSENRRRAGTTTDRLCIDNDTRRAQDVAWCRAAGSCVTACSTALAGSAAFAFSMTGPRAVSHRQAARSMRYGALFPSAYRQQAGLDDAKP
jgi:hypothetical protein